MLLCNCIWQSVLPFIVVIKNETRGLPSYGNNMLPPGKTAFTLLFNVPNDNNTQKRKSQHQSKDEITFVQYFFIPLKSLRHIL